jgi:cytochrome bd ubiquinol oxidase subunit II
MPTTNWLFYTNFAVFSVFLTLFITELMGAILLLVDYDRSRARVLDHVVPIWEVTGTFAVFWVVTADFAYPSMLIPVATLLAGYIVVFLILLVARNASISFAEYIIKRTWLDAKKLYQTYAVATILIGVVVVVILSAIVSGAGVTLSTLSFSFVGWLANPGSLPYLLGVLLIGAGLAPVFYGIEELRRWTLPGTVAGVALEAVALHLYASPFLDARFLVPAALTILPAVLFQSSRTARIVTNKIVFGAVGCLIIFSQSYLVYPTAFHGGITVDAVTTTGPMVGAFEILTAVGIVIVGLLMALYLVVVSRSSRTKRVGEVPSAAVGIRPRNL